MAQHRITGPETRTADRPGSRRGHPERGAALVEMALVAPILLVILFGIWSVARAYNVQNTLDHAAREAARYGATVATWDPATTPDEVRAIADDQLASSAISPGTVATGCIELVAEGANGCSIGGVDQVISAPADEVVVNLQVTGYELSFAFFTHTVDLRAQSISRYEG